MVWCTEPYKGTILYVEFSSSHTRAGLDSKRVAVADAEVGFGHVAIGARSGFTKKICTTRTNSSNNEML